jgi:hypothetical protein
MEININLRMASRANGAGERRSSVARFLVAGLNNFNKTKNCNVYSKKRYHTIVAINNNIVGGGGGSPFRFHQRDWKEQMGASAAAASVGEDDFVVGVSRPVQ